MTGDTEHVETSKEKRVGSLFKRVSSVFTPLAKSLVAGHDLGLRLDVLELLPNPLAAAKPPPELLWFWQPA
jgi:hypothetical protein